MSSHKEKSASQNQSSVLTYSEDDINYSSDNNLFMSPQSHKIFEALQEDEVDLNTSSSRSNSNSNSSRGSNSSNSNDEESNDKDEEDDTHDYQKYLADVAGDSFSYDDEAPVSTTVSIDQSRDSIERELGISPQGKVDSAGKYNYKPLTPAVSKTQKWSLMDQPLEEGSEKEDASHRISPQNLDSSKSNALDILRNMVESAKKSSDFESLNDSEYSGSQKLAKDDNSEDLLNSLIESQSKNFKNESVARPSISLSSHGSSNTSQQDDMEKLADIEFEINPIQKDEYHDIDHEQSQLDENQSQISEEILSSHEDQTQSVNHENTHDSNNISLFDDEISSQKGSQPLSPRMTLPESPILKSKAGQNPSYATPQQVDEDTVIDQPEKQKQTISMTPSKLPTGCISPFSPIARKIRIQRPSASLQTPPQLPKTPGRPLSESDSLQITDFQRKNITWSLTPCRKVSIVIKISHPEFTKNDEKSLLSNDKKQSITEALCLYPFLDSKTSTNNSKIMNSPFLSPLSSTLAMGAVPMTPKSMVSTMTEGTTYNDTLGANTTGREIILVNPKAFGKLIPPELTYETARIVSEARHIASEDWVRLFKFDDILWPTVGNEPLGGYSENCLIDTCAAVVKDALNENRSTVIFSHGGYSEGRNFRAENLFGIAGMTQESSERKFKYEDINGKHDKLITLLDQLGICGIVTYFLLNESAQCRFVISMLEIVEDDVLVDLLGGKEDSESLRIRHPDTKGAIVQNLTEMDLNNIDTLYVSFIIIFFCQDNINESKLANDEKHASFVQFFLELYTNINSLD